MSRTKKKQETFLQRKIRGVKRTGTFIASLKKNRKKIGKAFNGICEIAARIMEKKL